jgi:hypothetical protein
LPSGVLIPFENCPEAFQKPFGISQRLSYTLLAEPSGCPTAFKSISQQVQLKHGNFHPFFLKGCISAHISKTLEEPLKILKTTSVSSPRTDLSNKITFSQSQSHATVPLGPLTIFVETSFDYGERVGGGGS